MWARPSVGHFDWDMNSVWEKEHPLEKTLGWIPLDNFFFFLINLFIYLFLAVLGLSFCARAFSSCGERGPLSITVRGPLTIAASLVAEHRLQTRRLSSCGSRAQLLRGMWDLPRPGLEPVSPALAGRFSTTAPPGKPHLTTLRKTVLKSMFGTFSPELESNCLRKLYYLSCFSWSLEKN